MIIAALVIVLLLLALPAIPVGIGLGYAWVKSRHLRVENAGPHLPPIGGGHSA
ncbi:MAG: hypothetical protein ACQSGP_16310 [Frankia sp.]